MCKVSQTNIDNNLVLYYGMPNCVVIRKQGAPFLKIQTLLIWWRSIDSVHSYLCTWAPRTQMNWQQAFAVVLAEMVNGFLDLPGSLAVHKLPLCTLQAINELETWSLGIRLRSTSYTSNHDKKKILTIIKLFLNSQDIVCFARHSVQTFDIQTCEEQQTIITAVSLSILLTVDMEIGVCGRECWMDQQGIVLGSTAWHCTPQPHRVFVPPNVGRLHRQFWHQA